MPIHPCCGYDLEKGAKFAAIIDVLFSIIELIAAMIFETGPITELTSETPNPNKRDENYVVSMTLFYGLILVIMRIVQLGCSILLLYGVVEKNRRKCKIWLIFSWFVVFLAVLTILYEVFVRDQVSASNESIAVRISIPSLELLVNWYIMLVIYFFMRGLKEKGGLGAYPNDEPTDEDGTEMTSVRTKKYTRSN